VLFSVAHFLQAANCLNLACSQGTSQQSCLQPEKPKLHVDIGFTAYDTPKTA